MRNTVLILYRIGIMCYSQFNREKLQEPHTQKSTVISDKSLPYMSSPPLRTGEIVQTVQT